MIIYLVKVCALIDKNNNEHLILTEYYLNYKTAQKRLKEYENDKTLSKNLIFHIDWVNVNTD